MRALKEIFGNKDLKIIRYDKMSDMVDIEGQFYSHADKHTYFFVFTNNMGWEHLSVSNPKYTPSWNAMCEAKAAFFDDEEPCIEVHPKKSEYKNLCETCLHIWRPIGQDLILPPSYLVSA